MLSAAVCGEVFASPSAEAVLAAIRTVAGPAGCLVVGVTGSELRRHAEGESKRGMQAASWWVSWGAAGKSEGTGTRGQLTRHVVWEGDQGAGRVGDQEAGGVGGQKAMGSGRESRRHGEAEGDQKARGGGGQGREAGFLVVSVSGTGKEVSWKRRGGGRLAEE